jgi:hypothetical protein
VRLAVLTALAAPPACASASDPASDPGPAGAWLWAGVPLSAVPASARTLYVLQGEVLPEGDSTSFRRRGVSPAAGDGRAIVPVIRLRALPRPEACAGLLEAVAAAWRARGRSVSAVQIDHDAPSRRLADYARFVRGVRRHLDPDLRLSVTGLADWLASADAAALADLSRAADEIAFMLYHERHAVPGLARHHATLARFPRAFRVGLLAGMDLPREVAANRHCLGSIVFLVGGESDARLDPPHP